MSKTTPATQFLAKTGTPFTVHTYDYDASVDRIGMAAAAAAAAAAALGEAPHRVLKTLMADVDGRPVCVVLPSDREVSMKKLAAVFSGKAAAMMAPAAAERLTGYRVGGISPFGQKKRVPTVIEAAALSEPLVYVNGGQRGLQLRLSPADAQAVLGAVAAAVVA